MKISSFSHSFLILWLCLPCLADAYQHILIDANGDAYFTVSNAGKGSKNISKHSLASSSNYLAYSIPDQANCIVSSLSLNFAGTKLAYSEPCVLPPVYRLIILDLSSKKIIASLDHGGNIFSFSPKGDAIAFKSDYPGSYDGEKPPDKFSPGIFVYNFQSNKLKLIYSWPSREANSKWWSGVDINWSQHDNNIYFTTGQGVYRYNVSVGTNEILPINGIYFSPDGKYYCNLPFNEGWSSLYETSTNKEMTQWEELILRKAGEWPPIANAPDMVCNFWINIKGNNIVVFGTNGGAKNIIFDADKGKVIGEFDGLFMGINKNGTKVAVHPSNPDGRSYSDSIEILNLLDLIKK